MKQTQFFQTLSDETRLRALLLMAGEQDLCVCELVQALDVPQPKMSRHMAALREAGIVCSRRRAQWVFYYLNPVLEDWQRRIIHALIDSGADEPAARRDRKRLKGMKNRPGRCSAA